MQPGDGPYPPPGVLAAGHFREGYGYRVRRPNGSGNWSLTYTVEGRGPYRQPGDVVLLGPDAAHDYSVPEGASGSFCGRTSSRGWGGSRGGVRGPSGRGCTGSISRPGATASGRGGLCSGCARTPSPGGLSGELALNGLEEVLLLAAWAGRSGGGRPVDPRVRRVFEVISSDPAARHSVSGLAARVSLSPSRLSHLFKQEVGDSVVGTVIRLRLRQAARLLEHTVDDVGAISREVGFGSPYYFSLQFRRHFGMSPRQYRLSLKRYN